ncbi:glycosyltransferase family 4 protein [Thauera mechernichensis]|uniref:Glycosyltransferase family 4 protein n=2 Tax=Thauera mechernichensis TaxID=82788 RepID=A0ABW3WFF5_9RHOO|nr:glycosyltransferase family 4 protein [Thauera mechernichensis]
MPSGENLVVDSENDLLRTRGHLLEKFTRQSDDILRQGRFGKIKGALSTPWNPWSATKIQEIINRCNPDICHVHNTFPLISPSIFRAIGKRSARVLTLHNYRLVCPAAIPMRDGKVCTECIDHKSVIPSLNHGCYRDSRIATIPLALNIALHRWLGTWKHDVDAFIALSDFQKQIIADAGLPEHKIHVKPNFYPGTPPVVPWSEREDYVVFVGRLSAEKGAATLIDAWRQWGESAPQLRLVGDGPLRSDLEKKAVGLPIRFLGQMPADKAQEQISKAKLLVLPSECFETFGLVVIEAFAFGTPVAVSNIGPLPSIVVDGSCGVVFPTGQPRAMLESVRSVWTQPSKLESMGQYVRKEFEKKYTEDANYEILMRIYGAAIAENQRV